MKLVFFTIGLLALHPLSYAQEQSGTETQAIQKNTQNNEIPSEAEIPEPQIGLEKFIELVLLKNIELRKKNSQKLFEKLVINKETNLLPIEVYKSLGFRLRDPFLVQPSEISTRLYTVAEDSKLYFQELLDLEKTWALLSTTRSRVLEKDNFSKLIEQNVALDSFDLWYRMTNNQQYNQWLVELKQQIRTAGKNIEVNKEEFAESDFGKMKIKNLELLADNSQLTQFFDTEAAYLFTRFGERNLPTDNLDKYNFAQKAICFPKAGLSQIGIAFLKENYPEVIERVTKGSLKQKIWQLSQSARELSKQLLRDPQNQQLQAVNYFLSDITLSSILLLNHERLNAYAENSNSFFAEQSNNNFSYHASSRLIEFINFQNHLYGLKILDSFLANERVASLNLQLLRGCVQLYGEDKSISNFVQSGESLHFESLNFPAATNVFNRLNQLSASWDGTKYIKKPYQENTGEVIAKKPSQIDIVQPKAANVVKEQLSKTPVQVSSSKINSSDSIIGVSAADAATLLENAGFKFTNYAEILELTKRRGYTIQVLTTSSASEAAEKARRMTQEVGEVKVYLSSVIVEGVKENRFKVLVTFFSGQANPAKYAELSSQANQIRGFIKRYKQVKRDAEPSSSVSNKVAKQQSAAKQLIDNKVPNIVTVQPARTKKIQSDSIVGASSEQAANLLKKFGFQLSSFEEVTKLTDQPGYSIQMLTTSSAKEAAAKASLLAKTNETKVYVSSVVTDGVVEKRYKVLTTFFSGLASDEQTDELKIKAKQLQGFLKPYRLIRKDLVR